MTTLSPDLKPRNLSPRTAALLASLLIFLTCAWFINTRPGWNVLSQYALTCAIVEHGSLSIDPYHEATNDKAFFNGHYYSDKSPVTAFLGVPALFAYRALAPALASDSSVAPRPALFEDTLARYITTLFSVGLSTALLAGMLTLLFARRGIAPPLAAVAAALWVGSTPLLGYGILFFNYLPACALALAGYALIDPILNTSALPRPREFRAFFLGGLLLGLAAWTLNTLGLAALALTLVILLQRPSISPRVLCVSRLVPWVLGGLCGAAGYAVYAFAIFGSLASPYAYEFDPFFREQMARGFMGATWPPRPLVAWLVTFHPFQGLFIWFPLTLLALGGALFALLPRRLPAAHADLPPTSNITPAPNPFRRDAAIALIIFLGLLLYNSAYFLWWGGWAYAPRHLIPALPFLALGLVPLLRSPRVAVTVLLVGAAATVFNVAAVALDPQPPPGIPYPVPQDLLMSLQRIERWPFTFYNLQTFFWRNGQVDDNWGLRLGLHGRASLRPLLALWLGIGALLFLSARRYRASSQTETAATQSTQAAQP